MSFGITTSGFSIPQLTDIQNEINASLQATFGANIDLSADSVFGQFSGVFAERESLLWQAMADVYNSQYPDTAFGASLDNVGAISGIPRLGPLPSTITGVLLFGTVGTVVPGAVLPTTATQFAVQNAPSSVFQLDASVTLVAGQSCVQTVSFSSVPTVGQWQLSSNGNTTPLFNFNDSAATIQAGIQQVLFCSGCTVTGNYSTGFTITFNGAGTGGFMVQPQFTVPYNTLEASAVIVAVTPLITVAGIPQGTGNLTAIADGPTIAPANTLNVINTPVSGLSAVLNISDASVGRLAETDNAYRARRSETLQVAGAGTFEAIRSRLLALSGVTAVVMFENVTDIVDLNGLPPKSFEATVQGGDETAIANLLWQIKPAGIETFGSITVPITDSQGQIHEISFSLPDELLIYIAVVLSVNPVTYPANGDAAVAQALTSFGNALGIGTEVIVSPYLYGSISNIPGINQATIYIGLTVNPVTSANIPVATNQIAVFDTSRINITHV